VRRFWRSTLKVVLEQQLKRVRVRRVTKVPTIIGNTFQCDGNMLSSSQPDNITLQITRQAALNELATDCCEESSG
jgi:hypothetical protein